MDSTAALFAGGFPVTRFEKCLLAVVIIGIVFEVGIQIGIHNYNIQHEKQWRSE
jgi:hypothetical protein